MDSNTTEEESKRQTGERPLPRGLEQVSHLFISHALSERVIPNRSQIGSEEQTHTVPMEKIIAAVLMPGRSPQRDDLMSLLRQQTGAVEEGMKTIDTNIPCETAGNIELLALDSATRLAVVDLDDKPNDHLLLRGIGHLDWLVQNVQCLRRMHQGPVINWSLRPRLFLVAPDYSPLFRCVTRQTTSIEIHCLKYHAIALSGGTGIFLEHAFASV